MIGSGDMRERGSLMEGCVVCIKEWMKEEISWKRGGRWEKGNILEGRGRQGIRQEGRRRKQREKTKNMPGRTGEKK